MNRKGAKGTKSGFILYYLSAFVNYISGLINNSYILSKLCNYELFGQKCSQSFLLSPFFHMSRLKSGFLRYKLSMADMCQKSRIIGFFKKLNDIFLYSSLHSFSIFGFFYGGFIMSAVIANKTGNLMSILFENRFIYSALVILISALLFPFTKTTVIGAFSSGKITSYFVFDILAISKKKIENKIYHYSGELMILGIITGIVSYTTSIGAVIMLLLAIALLDIIFIKPENGILILCLTLPFVNEKDLLYISLLTVLSHAFKVIRGKRALQIKITSSLLLFTGLIIALQTLFSFGTGAEKQIYVILNIIFTGISVMFLINSSTLADKCFKAITISGTLSAVCLIIDKIPYLLSQVGLSSVSERASKFLSVNLSYEYFAVFALCALPLIFARKPRLKGMITVPAAVTVILALVFTHSYDVIFSLLIAFALIIVIYNKFGGVALASSLICLYLLNRLNIIHKFVFDIQQTDSSIKYAANRFIAKYWFSGSGIGSNSIGNASVIGKQLIPLNDNVSNSYLYLIMKIGIPLSAVIIVLIIYTVSRPMSYSLDKSSGSNSKTKCTAIMCSLFSLIIYSFYFNIFASAQTISILVIIISLGCATADSAESDYLRPDYTRI